MRIAVAALCLAGCFSPDVTTGAPCSASGACPGDLECAPETLTCERPEPDDGCYGSFGEICIPTPDEPLEYDDTTIDTDDDDDCLGSSVIPYCVVAGTTVAVSGKLRAKGSRPLVLIATSTMRVTGTIDASSHRGSDDFGAGADPTACAALQLPDVGAGGAGGSFGGRGGIGGIGDVVVGALQSAPAVFATELRGGCAGGDGTSGDGGHGGGAIYLIARKIEVSGVINASGASGGGSSDDDAGGGGGGSGGMIVLDANVVVIAGQVFANGGAGGAGNNQNADAEDPKSALVRARGGEDTGGDSGNTGDGGDGAAADVLDGGAGSSGSDGGGGGGGGAGIIRVLMRELPEGSIRGAISPTAR